jgi:hypothetical protein
MPSILMPFTHLDAYAPVSHHQPPSHTDLHARCSSEAQKARAHSRTGLTHRGDRASELVELGVPLVHLGRFGIRVRLARDASDVCLFCCAAG